MKNIRDKHKPCNFSWNGGFFKCQGFSQDFNYLQLRFRNHQAFSKTYKMKDN